MDTAKLELWERRRNFQGFFFKAADAEYGTQVPQIHIFVFPPWKDDLSSLGSRQVEKNNNTQLLVMTLE